MSIYWAFLRLHLLWFILYNLVCVGIFFTSWDIRLVILLKLVGYPTIYLISRPFNKRHDYYFKNIGLFPPRLFMVISLMDLTAFSILMILSKLLF